MYWLAIYNYTENCMWGCQWNFAVKVKKKHFAYENLLFWNKFQEVFVCTHTECNFSLLTNKWSFRIENIIANNGYKSSKPYLKYSGR